jgi:hypothetical protein
MHVFILVFALTVLVSGVIALVLALREFTKMLEEADPDPSARGPDAESGKKTCPTKP